MVAALIIGAGDATGGAIARAFAAEGLTACVNRRPRHADKLEELAPLTRRELDRHLSAPPVAEEEDKNQENVFGGSDGET